MSIILENLKVEFKNHMVFEKINIQIQKGEKVVFIGPSGGGKTVLLKIMAGLLSPALGKVLINSKDLATLGNNERSLLIKSMGMLFQKNALFDSLTCGNNIAFPLRETTTLSEEEIQKKVTYFLNEVGISHAEFLFPDEISGGMQKRLGIARALALNPEIILYDDPTAGLDPITSRKIIDLILRLQKQNNTTLIAVTNDMNRAYQLADRIYMVMDQQVFIAGEGKSATLENKDPRVYNFVRGLSGTNV